VKLENEIQIAIADQEKATLDSDEMRSEERVRLRRSLDTLRGKRDVVVIDTPPSLEFLMVSTLVAADWFIIPVFPSGYDLKGLELLMRTVSKVRERYNPGLRLAGVLLGNYDRTATWDRQIHEMLKKRFGDEVVFLIRRSAGVCGCAMPRCEGKRFLSSQKRKRKASSFSP
jgi:chromosome partitioning protein